MKSTFRPLQIALWGESLTPRHQRRSRYTFKAGYSDTLYLLEREIELLGAGHYVIEADFTEKHLRKDGGGPLSSAPLPTFPGVRVAFDSRDHGPLIYQTDSCELWQHNVRSVALGLAALRDVERYGISKRNQQYVGFKELGSATAMGASSTPAMTRGQAYTLVYAEAGIKEGADVLMIAWKRARKRAHPDSATGSAERWEQLERAGHILGIA